jgi:hypothetical protein
VAGWYKSTRVAVVLATPSPAQAAALLDKGYTVVNMSDPAHWVAQFGQYPLIFGGVTGNSPSSNTINVNKYVKE